MGLISWLASKFGGTVPFSGAEVATAIEEYASEVHIRELAFWSSVNMIANSVSKCEFKTFQNGKEVKEKEYYLWNIEPNKNQNSSGFMHKLIGQLYKNNECLVIQENEQLLVADSFNQKEFALRDNLFTEVTVGDFSFNRTYSMSEVLYFKLSEKDMRKVVNTLYDSYARLIIYGMKAYQKSRGTKGIFSYDTLPVAGTPEREAFDSLINEKFKKFMESPDAVLPLGRGQSYKEEGSKTYANDSTRDIRAMIDDISDFTAKAFGIPPALLKGDIAGTKDALNNYLTFCIDPLVDMIAEEINRKRNRYEAFRKDTYLKIDTRTIMHIDLLSIPTAIDKLVASGTFCVNDIRKLLGEPVLDEPWAWKHFITKNYAEIEQILETLEGGE